MFIETNQKSNIKMERLDKKILIKEFAARLPYNMKFFAQSEGRECTAYKLCPENEWVIGYDDRDEMRWYNIEEVTPYLRPMSSMTEEEIEIFNSDFGGVEDCYNSIEVKRIDWLLEHHFDYRGLINKGLALEAPKGMYV